MDSKFSYLFQELELKKRIFYCAGQWYWKHFRWDYPMNTVYLGTIDKVDEKALFRNLFRYIAEKYKHLLHFCLNNKQIFITKCACLCTVEYNGKTGINPAGTLRIERQVITFNEIRDIKDGEIFTYWLMDYIGTDLPKYNKIWYDCLCDVFFPNDIPKEPVINRGLLNHPNIFYLRRQSEYYHYHTRIIFIYNMCIGSILYYMSKKSVKEVQTFLNEQPMIILDSMTYNIGKKYEIALTPNIKLLQEILHWLLYRIKYSGKIVIDDQFITNDLLLSVAIDKYDIRQEQIIDFREPEPKKYVPLKTFPEKLLRARQVRYHSKVMKDYFTNSKTRVPKDIVNLCLKYL